MSYSAPALASLDAKAGSDMPAADAVARIWRNSLLFSIVSVAEVFRELRGVESKRIGRASGRRRPTGCCLLVDRRLRVEQQGHHVLDLLFRQDAGGAETRHVVARR